MGIRCGSRAPSANRSPRTSGPNHHGPLEERLASTRRAAAMFTREQNERRTRVVPDAPGGKLLRRYWQALCPTKELAHDVDRKRIRLLGEDLLVFRDAQGTFRCVQERCP